MDEREFTVTFIADDEGPLLRLAPLRYPTDWDDEDDTPRWTWRRVLYLLIVLVVIIALLATTLWPLLTPNTAPMPLPLTPDAIL